MSFSLTTVGVAIITELKLKPIPSPSMTWYVYCADETSRCEVNNEPIRARPTVYKSAVTRKM